jgi:methyl-accepting chemotaxis protein
VNPLARLTLGVKLYVMVAIGAVMLLATGLNGLYSLNQSSAALTHLYKDRLVSIQLLNEVRTHQLNIQLELLGARLENDAFEIQPYMERLDGRISRINEVLAEYKKHLTDAREKPLYEAFIKARLDYGNTAVMPMRDMLSAEKWDEADQLRKGGMRAVYTGASDAIDALIKHQVEGARASHDGITALNQRMQIVAIATMLAGLVLTTVLGILIARSINRGVKNLCETAERLKQGDLSARADIRGADELGRLAQSFNTMAEQFSGVIRQVGDSVGQVSQAANRLTEASEQVARGSEIQRVQADRAFGATEHLNGAIQQVSSSVPELVAASERASQLAEQGRDTVSRAADGIARAAGTVNDFAQQVQTLGQRSNEIGRIVKVIKEIADQTNLLALNAAIEAARAGEQGRGFAVVADEVRKLAERTAQATSEISSMIGAIQQGTTQVVAGMQVGSQQVEEGVTMSNEAGESLAQILQGVASLTGMIRQIAQSVAAQQSASREISEQVGSMAHAAQNNAVAVQDATAAAHGLSGMADQMHRSVAAFRIG